VSVDINGAWHTAIASKLAPTGIALNGLTLPSTNKKRTAYFGWSTFLLAVSLSASWQIAFGPYVADYSRYLPSNTSSWKTFTAVSLGTVLGAQASMVLGPWRLPPWRCWGSIRSSTRSSISSCSC
jgi:purine-cytosine permease-like protein